MGSLCGGFSGSLFDFVHSRRRGKSAYRQIIIEVSGCLPEQRPVNLFLYHRVRSGEINQIRDGYESIQPGLGSVDQFKSGMGFRKAPTGQRLELAGWVRPLVNRVTVPPTVCALQWFGKNETTAKLHCILRWYQQQPVFDRSQVQPRPANADAVCPGSTGHIRNSQMLPIA